MRKYIATLIALLMFVSFPAFAGDKEKKTEVIQGLEESLGNKDLVINYRGGIRASTARGEVAEFYQGRPAEKLGVDDPLLDLPGLRRLKGDRTMLMQGEAVKVDKFVIEGNTTLLIYIVTKKMNEDNKPYKVTIKATAPNLLYYSVEEIVKYAKYFISPAGEGTATAQTR